MRCVKCLRKGVSNRRCKRHFIDYFEEKVHSTIEKHGLITPGQKVCVAVSGGKDSMTLLHLLKKYKPTVLAVDEGIKSYREHTLDWLMKYCKKHKLALRVVSFKRAYGKTLDEMEKKHPCTECGKRRRELLNKHAKGFDVIAIGHNLDDGCQTILMNLFKGNTEMMPRALVKSKRQSGYVQRIRPLYECTEKEILTYAYLQGLTPRFVECPYMHESFRNDVREELNKMDKTVKKNIMKKYLDLMRSETK